MPNDPENKFDSKPAIIPVRVGDETHHVEFPSDTPVEEVHRALLNHLESAPEISDPNFKNKGVPYSDPDKSGPYGWKEAQPTRENVVENSPEFKAVGKAVYEASGRGRNPNEAGTFLDDKGERGPIAVSNTEGRMALAVPSNATATIHSHPAHFHGATASPLPSATDVATARKLGGRPVYVVSPEGLSVVEGDGKITSIYSNKDWMDRNNK
jgi:hypothetical protein